jgi:hypothetical protein
MNDPDQAEPLRALTSFACRHLAAEWQGGGLPAVLQEPFVYLAEPALAVQPVVTRYAAQPEGHMVQLEVALWPDLDPGRPIWVAGVALAAEPEAAVHDALATWREGVFPPIQAALRNDPMYLPERLGGDGTAAPGDTCWDAYDGVLQLAGDGAESLRTWLGGGMQILGVLIESLCTTLAASEAQAGPQALHWLKVFVARGASGEVSGECLLDNAAWPEGWARLMSLGWPETTGYLAFRQFIILRRVDPGTEGDSE